MDNLERFILNIGKATQKPEVFLEAKPKELDVTLDYALRFISVVAFVVFAWWAL